MGGSYDAIVVGSGFGGGIAACRLAEAGRSVCVLERGRRFAPHDFIDRPEQLPDLLWHERANPGGMFDVRLLRDVTVITAAGVGGGSLVYANVQLRAPADVFATGWPAAITRDALDPWYDRTEEALEPRTTPDDPPLDKVRAFAAMGARAGAQGFRLPLAVHFGPDRANPFSGVAQQGCQNLGRCDIGCPVGAKNTVDITYVARAEQHGAEVRPLHLVTRIDPPAQPGRALAAELQASRRRLRRHGAGAAGRAGRRDARDAAAAAHQPGAAAGPVTRPGDAASRATATRWGWRSTRKRPTCARPTTTSGPL